MANGQGSCESFIDCEEFRGGQRLGVHIRGVERPADLAGFDLSEGDLLLHTFLGVSGIVVGHGYNCTIVLHDDRW